MSNYQEPLKATAFPSSTSRHGCYHGLQQPLLFLERPRNENKIMSSYFGPGLSAAISQQLASVDSATIEHLWGITALLSGPLQAESVLPGQHSGFLQTNIAV